MSQPNFNYILLVRFETKNIGNTFKSRAPPPFWLSNYTVYKTLFRSVSLALDAGALVSDSRQNAK